MDISIKYFLLHVIMRWLLAGYFGLVFINISAVQAGAPRISQQPRFSGQSIGSNATIYCLHSKPHQNDAVKWFKAEKYDSERKDEITEGERIKILRTNSQISFLYIKGLNAEDGGAYFCQINGTMGPGTELQVARYIFVPKLLKRTQMKDVLIIFQALLFAVWIAGVLLRKRQLQYGDRDSLYEEPETDHIYEGLTIETCGGGLYEELSVYAQAEGTEAPWE